MSSVDLPWLFSKTFIIPDPAAMVSKGFGPSIPTTVFSVLAGRAFLKPCPSVP